MSQQLVNNIKNLCTGEDGRPKTVADLEKQSKLSTNSIYRWTSVTPGYDKVLKVAKVLNVSVEELVKGDDEETNE